MNASSIACIAKVRIKKDRYNCFLFDVSSIGNTNIDKDMIKPIRPNSMADSKNALWQWNLFLL